jgi:hypothetical protein
MGRRHKPVQAIEMSEVLKQVSVKDKQAGKVLEGALGAEAACQPSRQHMSSLVSSTPDCGTSAMTSDLHRAALLYFVRG